MEVLNVEKKDLVVEKAARIVEKKDSVVENHPHPHNARHKFKN